MSARPRHEIRWETWELVAAADRRFRRIVGTVATIVLILAIIVSIWELTEPPQPELQFNGQQFVKLMPAAAPEVAKPEEPKPASPQPEKKAEQKPQVKKPETKPEPAAKPQPTAREVAQKSGLMALTDQLKDLRDQQVSAVTTTQALTGAISSKGGVGSAVAADAIAASAASGGGAVIAAGSVTGSQSGTGVGDRHTGAVKSNIPTKGADIVGAGKAGPASRTPAEVQAVFERNQGPFYAIYNRAARENASITRGKIVVRIVIAPSGAVSSASLVTSSFGDADFERKIVERVKLLNFGAKNVPDFTIDYPISFIPQ